MSQGTMIERISNAMKNREYVQEVYQYIHEKPEIAFEEVRTSAFLADELEKYGYKVTRGIGGTTGVLGVLDSGVPGPVLGMRADMDALKYEIDGKTEYRHACGHDSHSGMVMAAAREIADRGIEKGKLYVIFQPGEESLKGSNSIIKSGLFNDMTEIVGIHLRPIGEAVLGTATAALWHGGCAPTTIRIKGMTAHGARPHLGINPVETAILMANAINSIRIDPRVSHSIKITRIDTGVGTVNTIAEEAVMTVDVRCQNNEEMDKLLEKMNRAIQSTAEAMGATAEVDTTYVPAAIYSDEMTATNAEAICEVLGKENLVPDIHTPGSEDFHFFAKLLGCKAGYIGLGADLVPGLHSKDMKFNTEALYKGVEILVSVVGKRLGYK